MGDEGRDNRGRGEPPKSVGVGDDQSLPQFSTISTDAPAPLPDHSEYGKWVDINEIAQAELSAAEMDLAEVVQTLAYLSRRRCGEVKDEA